MLSGCGESRTVSEEKAEILIPTNAVISYLGPEGTYTEEAAKQFFGTDSDTRPQTTVADAVDMLLDGKCDYAVIPQENTIGGSVYDYLDEFLSHKELSVLAENIQINEDNKTRFYVLSTDAPSEKASDRMVFTACGEAAELPELLSKTEKHGLTPIYIHDRPEKTVMGKVYLANRM